VEGRSWDPIGSVGFDGRRSIRIVVRHGLEVILEA
jgi:hypothetical protein